MTTIFFWAAGLQNGTVGKRAWPFTASHLPTTLLPFHLPRLLPTGMPSPSPFLPDAWYGTGGRYLPNNYFHFSAGLDVAGRAMPTG